MRTLSQNRTTLIIAISASRRKGSFCHGQLKLAALPLPPRHPDISTIALMLPSLFRGCFSENYADKSIRKEFQAKRIFRASRGGKVHWRFFTNYDSAHSSSVSLTLSTANRKNATASACRFISLPYAHLSASSIRFFHCGYLVLAHSPALFLEPGWQ
jgi:hypothetical protein